MVLELMKGKNMHNKKCQECEQSQVTTIFEISDDLIVHLCPSCFNKSMSELMAIDLNEFETKEFTFKDERGDKYIVRIEMLGYQTGIGFEVRQKINDGSGHKVSITGNIECEQKEIWNQLLLKINTTIHTRYLELVDRPYGEAQNQLFGDEVAGTIEYDGNRYDEIPKLVIDGKKYTWKEFGRMLSPSSGNQFKLKIYNQHEETE